MPKQPDIRLTDREAQVMEVLWSRGPSTVSEVREHLSDELAYTTVLTILRTLEAKDYVDHDPEGKAHRYVPLVARENAQRSALRALVEKLFEGSTEILLTHMVAEEHLSEAQVRRIQKLLEQRRKRDEAG
jgi:predicted transcriptional regulator